MAAGGEAAHLEEPDEVRILPMNVADNLDWGDNERGVSYCFGKAIINDFLLRYDMDLICRAHMVVEDGYEFWNDRTLVTVFSAPNYCGGAIIQFSKLRMSDFSSRIRQLWCMHEVRCSPRSSVCSQLMFSLQRFGGTAMRIRAVETSGR